jgi:hypothetical protein
MVSAADDFEAVFVTVAGVEQRVPWWRLPNNPPLQVTDDDQWQHRPDLAEARSTAISPGSSSENRQTSSSQNDSFASETSSTRPHDYRTRR